MTKRQRLTVEEVLDNVLSDEEDAGDVSELLEADYDNDEPMMEESDEEFSASDSDDDDDDDPHRISTPSRATRENLLSSSFSTDFNDEHFLSSPMAGPSSYSPNFNADQFQSMATSPNSRCYSPDFDDEQVPSTETSPNPSSVADHSLEEHSTEEESSEEDSSTWTDKLKAVTIEEFASNVGPTVPISDSPLDVFELFFPVDLQEKIVEESNRYASQVMGGEKYSSWKKITAEELRAFFGFSILMGVNHLPSIDDYWSKDPMLHYSPIADRIPRWRYREISRYLHLTNNDDLLTRDDPAYKLGKVRPLIDHICEKFTSVYEPSKFLAVDEAMIKFTGRSSLKQYLPKKPVKRGIKVWALADSKNGYMGRFDVYTGKKGNREVDLGRHVVNKLTEDLHNKYHHVFFDNYFTGMPLLEDLQEHSLYGCGTIRSNRKGFPSELKFKKVKPKFKNRESKTLQRGNLTASAWMDNKVVTVMSTTTEPDAVGEVLRRQKDGSRILVSCPEAIITYNQYMGGVDKNDQLRGYYQCRTKSRKFYKYIYHFLFDVSITNAYILHKRYSNKPYKTVKEFRLHLAKQLIGDFCSRCRAGRYGGGVCHPLPIQHFPSKVGPQKERKRGRCSHCQTYTNTRTDTSWYCHECQLWLCHSGDFTTDCFYLWHKHRVGGED